MPSRSLYLVASLSAVMAAGSPAVAATPEDPYESSNRGAYAFQDGLNHSILAPLVTLYRALTPGPIGRAIHNVLNNVGQPVVIINDLLQGRVKRAGQDTLRLAANTLAGWGGLMDVASPAGLPYRPNDFGITLGRWGVAPGPYLFLPLIGPTTPRDLFGNAVDIGMHPLTWIDYPYKWEVNVGRTVFGGFDGFSQGESQLEALTADAADPYATLRSVYLQDRAAKVRGQDEAPPPTLEDIPSAPDSATPDGSAPAGPPPGPGAAAPDQPAPAASTVGPQSENDIDFDAPVATARDYHPVSATASLPATPAA